ncbi:hypothetical protein SDC9_82790 [bioreactor metagenome]|uniref:Uncharacterized protein n=1 Tax=bioreactor metagenome TaxID=1076179 RepID=A0A644Z5J6_9ZZZZ
MCIVARLEICGNIKFPVIGIFQLGIGIYPLVEQSVNGQCSSSSLSVSHTVEVNGRFLPAYPGRCYYLGCERHKPRIGIVVGRSGFGSHLPFQVVQTAQPASRTSVNHGLEHVEHLIGSRFAENLLHSGNKVGHHVSVRILDTGNQQRFNTNPAVDERRVRTGHLIHRSIIWP